LKSFVGEYEHEKDSSSLDHITTIPKIILFDDHPGGFTRITPNFAAIVVNTNSKNILILAWEGSLSAEDWGRNFLFDVATSNRWKDVSKTVAVQGSILSVVENDITNNEDFLIEYIHDNTITEIIFTGHSLGGGIASVGHVMIQGQFDAKSSGEYYPNPWTKVKDQIQTLLTVSFEGNTSVMFKPTSNLLEDKKGLDFLQKIASTSFTTVFHMDVVPRLNNQLGFLFQLIENIVKKEVIDGSQKYDVDLSKLKRILEVAAPFLLIPIAKNIPKVMETIKETILPYILVSLRYDHLGQARIRILYIVRIFEN